MSRRPAALALAALAALAVSVPASSAPSARVPSGGTVVKAVDGDTLRVRAAGRVLTVDLLGIDAPELRGAGGPDCFGPTAFRRLRGLAPAGSRVRLVPLRGARVVSARVRANVLLGGRSLARPLVQGGFVRTAGAEEIRGGQALIDAETRAQERARGLWSVCEGLGPADETEDGGDVAPPPPAVAPPAPAAPAPAPPAPAPAPATPPPGGGQAGGQPAPGADKAAITARFTQLLANRTISSEFSDSSSLTQRVLTLCGNGRFLDDRNTIFTTAGGSITSEDRGAWRITDAGAQGDVTGVILTLDLDGPDPDATVEVDMLGDGSITLAGRPASLAPATGC